MCKRLCFGAGLLALVIRLWCQQRAGDVNLKAGCAPTNDKRVMDSPREVAQTDANKMLREQDERPLCSRRALRVDMRV